MSSKLVGIVLECALPRPEKYLLIALADHAKEDGSDVYPSLLNMEWKLGYSQRQLRRVLLALEAKGVLQVVHRGGAGPGDVTKYRIIPERIPMLESFRSWATRRRREAGHFVTLQGGHSEQPKADILSKKGGHFVPKKAVKMSLEPRTIEPKTEPRTRTERAREFAKKVLALRANRQPTDEARRQLGAALGTMSADAIQEFIDEVEKRVTA